MQRLIAWLLEKYTPFRVTAWAGGKIAGIGFPTPRHRPTIAELEQLLNSSEHLNVIVAPDGSISAVSDEFKV